MKILSDRLKELRREQKLTQKELAKISGIGQASISDWEKGKYEPTATNIKMICITLKTSADYLLGLEDETGTKTYINNSFNNFKNTGNFKI